jgi:hypothetical protein
MNLCLMLLVAVGAWVPFVTGLIGVRDYFATHTVAFAGYTAVGTFVAHHSPVPLGVMTAAFAYKWWKHRNDDDDEHHKRRKRLADWAKSKLRSFAAARPLPRPVTQ